MLLLDYSSIIVGPHIIVLDEPKIFVYGFKSKGK